MTGNNTNLLFDESLPETHNIKYINTLPHTEAKAVFLFV